MTNSGYSMDLSGKTILITGAARRIGRILALAAARAGADLLIHYHSSLSEAHSLRSEIMGLGRRAGLVSADLTEPDGPQKVFTQTEQLGHVDILVNSASVFEPLSFVETSYQDWRKNLDIHLTAPFLLSQLFANRIPEDQSGRIINMLDWRALRPGATHFPYEVSKAGLAALTRSLAVALAPRIQVNGLALGAVLPPAGGVENPRLLDSVPAARWANLVELEQAFLFLAGGPQYITGEILHLDGGRHLI